ncbi:MAG: 50S ribosomal protein L20 [Patescibacteria group bacterium]|nr:50S ribosomal protein L20 [Patescibacteria group bacterium]
MRVKGGVKSHRKHKKVLEEAKGYWRKHRNTIRKAKETLLHAGQYAYDGRKMKKRDFRSIWIIRINAAVRQAGMKYSEFISRLSGKNIDIDRKILSQLAADHPKTFGKIVDSLK